MWLRLLLRMWRWPLWLWLCDRAPTQASRPGGADCGGRARAWRRAQSASSLRLGMHACTHIHIGVARERDSGCAGVARRRRGHMCSTELMRCLVHTEWCGCGRAAGSDQSVSDNDQCAVATLSREPCHVIIESDVRGCGRAAGSRKAGTRKAHPNSDRTCAMSMTWTHH